MTQITLGASLGELALGRKAGNRAMLWGAIAGTIPDLDIALNPFLDAVEKVAFHRGFTHSFVFALLLPPLLALGLRKLYRGNYASYREWCLLLLLAVGTHPILDYFTMYGTQLFLPFSNYPAALGSIAVIDPVYTVPFLICVLISAFLHRTSRRRRVLNLIGLSVSTLYLTLTVVNKVYVESVFDHELKRRGIIYDRMFTSPTFFNNILWRCVVESDSQYWEGYFSLMDQSDQVAFSSVAKGHHLIDSFANDVSIERLKRFSHGYFSVTQAADQLHFNDLRFGRTNVWDMPSGDYIFSFSFPAAGSGGESLVIERNPPAFRVSSEAWRLFWQRVWGRRAMPTDPSRLR